MKKKKIVIALGHEALGTTLPEQKEATKRTAKAVADFIRDDYQVVITHSNGPQVGMIHTAMNEFCRLYPEYTATPMSVCSAMSQGYIGYDLQNAIRADHLTWFVKSLIIWIDNNLCHNCGNYKNLQKAENLNRKQTLIRLRLYEVHAKIITMTKSQYRRI